MYICYLLRYYVFFDTVILALRKVHINYGFRLVYSHTSWIEINTLPTLVPAYVCYSHAVVVDTGSEHIWKVSKQQIGEPLELTEVLEILV